MCRVADEKQEKPKSQGRANAGWEKAKKDIPRHDEEFERKHGSKGGKRR